MTIHLHLMYDAAVMRLEVDTRALPRTSSQHMLVHCLSPTPQSGAPIATLSRMYVLRVRRSSLVKGLLRPVSSCRICVSSAGIEARVYEATASEVLSVELFSTEEAYVS